MNTTHFDLSITRIHVFSMPDGYMLMDVGYDYDKEAFIAGMQKLGIAFSDIKYIFMTHHHDDHAGLLNYVIEQNPDARIICHSECAKHLLGGSNYPPYEVCRHTNGGFINVKVQERAMQRKAEHPEWSFGFPPFSIRDTDIVIDGDDDELMRKIGIPAKILHTPGHSPDSISLLLDNGDCYAGDAASTLWLDLDTKYMCICMGDMNLSYFSWAKLIAEGAKTIFHAHGDAFPVERLKENMYKVEKGVFYGWDKFNPEWKVADEEH